jgi:bacillolysin
MPRSADRLYAAVMIALLIGFAIHPAAARTNNAFQSRVDRIALDPNRGTAEIVTGEFRQTGAADFAAAAVGLIDSRPDLFGLTDAQNELRVLRQETDQLGNTHVRLDQTYQGLRVWGCQKIVHFKDISTIYMVAGQTIPTPDISISPSVTSSAAEQLGLGAVSAVTGGNDVSTVSELLVFPEKSLGRLAWLVTVKGVTNHGILWRVFVDAKSGAIIQKYNDIQDDGPTVGSGVDVNSNVRTLQTYLIGPDYKLIDASRPMYQAPISNMKGVIVTYSNRSNGGAIVVDPNGDDNFNDNTSLKAAVSGHFYGAKTYEYYRTSIGRNSIDNNGMSIVVNVHDPTYVNNAFWDGSQLNLCDGDGTTYRNFAGSLDVVAHEMTHGVTQYTAGLIYSFQSGALNESFSDFFGAMVDSANWLMGEEIRITAPGFLRSLQDPHQGPNPTRFPFGYQPAKLSEYVDSAISYDNGGVHTNDGIPNKAGYLVGSTIGRPKAAQIWYRTLSVYLTPSSDFNFWANMTMQSAADLYGDPSPEMTSVLNALDSIGYSLIFVKPQQVAPLAASIGTIADTTVTIRNRRAETVTLQSYTTAKGKVTVSGTFPITLTSGDSSIIHIGYDATAATSCNVGSIPDTVIVSTSSITVPTIRIPVSVGLGFVKTTPYTTSVSTACLSAIISNSPSLANFTRNSQNALSKATLLVGYRSGADTIVYMDMYQGSSYAVVDSIATSTASNSDIVKQYRIASNDGRLQGRVKYQYEPTDVAGCGYVVVDFTLYNNCSASIDALSGLLADFDMTNSSTNQCFYDAGNKMIHIQDGGNTQACGLALLSGTPRNLRAINNPSLIYNGLSAGSAYKQLAGLTNVSGATSDDWSALLTFGQDTLAAGDTAHYRTAMLFSTSGSSGLATIVSQVNPLSCCVGKRGNVNMIGIVDLGDLSSLVSYLTGGGYVLPCVDAANVNGIGIVDLGDLSALVSYLTSGGFVLPNCP